MKIHPARASRIAACLLALAFSTPSAVWGALETLDLAGREWSVAESGTRERLQATVPGSIHTDLLAAGKIQDPFFRDNELKLQWIGEKSWTYQRGFEVSAEFLKHETVLLRCDGLDTLATLRLNGREVATTDNQFRTWEFKVNDFLKPGTNQLEIRFDSVLSRMAALEKSRPLPTWNHPGASYIRKTPCNFGWDWGPTLVTCGIWRGISLVGFDTARWDNVLILQDHSQPGRVQLEVKAVADPPSLTAPLRTRITLTGPDGKPVATRDCRLATGQVTTLLDVPQPQLWWPAGMGAQPLYTLTCELFDAQNQPLDVSTKRIGLRTLRVVPQSGEETLHFVANGVPFFAKGANCIPLDLFPARVTREQMRRHIADAVAVNMNSLRFWGGGSYEDDALFDACDEMGICVWLDFKFSCATYPSFDPAFLENVRQEARDNVRRLRHHPSIGLWCGNNEIQFFRGKDHWDKEKMSEADYYKLFRDTLGEVVRADAPQSDYVTGSPDCGDVHYWGVWHGGKPFEAYGEIHGFLSEFGFQSWPVPQTVAAFTEAADRDSVYSPVMRMHERSGRGYLGSTEDGTIGTNRLLDVVRMYFREPKDFTSTLWLSQITQAYGIEYAAQLWRREMPRSMGCVFWQYNDIWPGTSWASVDSFGRWKALHYRARHFYAPLLVSGTTDAANGTASLWVTSDQLQDTTGTLRWQLTDLTGSPLATGSQPVAIPARKSQLARELKLSEMLGKPTPPASVLLWVALECGGETVSQNLLTFAKPKELELMDPQLKLTVTGSATHWTATLTATHPALWAWLELTGTEARFSDNFIHLQPGVPVKIEVTTDREMTRDEFVRGLTAQSLFDTFTHSR